MTRLHKQATLIRTVPKGGPYCGSAIPSMKPLFAVIVVLVLFLNSCASIMDAKFTTRDGKDSPFKPQKEFNPAPKDPLSHY